MVRVNKGHIEVVEYARHEGRWGTRTAETGVKKVDTMSTTETENEQLVREFHRRILTENDFDAADELLVEDYVEHNPVLPEGKIQGREKMIGVWEDMFEEASDLSIIEQDVISDGNIVASRTIARGTHDFEFMGVEPTGNEFEVPGMDFYRIEERKIAESWVCVDSLGMMQQLGAIEPPGE